ncbi:hypothetical protein ABGB17_02005 [Sphaerisporangium sp. B11E5]|uniref:hypothetical protein n=1 Tax=Sphaerisporangium sp. B11E5 TaxID=3153563 RepID=UPI00325D329B
MTPDETLGAIDDVLAGWHGGPDAMVWTAEHPTPEVVCALRGERNAAYEARHAAAPVSGETARTAAGALARGIAEWARSPAVRRMVDLVRTLDRQASAAQEAGTGPCHCPCGTRHGERVCTGTATGTRLSASLGDGLADLPMCGPCLSSG